MAVITKYIELSTKGNADIKNISREVEKAVSDSGIKDGIVTVFCKGSTGAVTTIEYESGLIEDLQNALERIAPRNIEYKHHLRWRDGNGHSHVRASLLGPSVTVPIIDGRMPLGTWQQLIFIDLDNRPRSRKLIVQIMGE
ncbi:MAG: secondary thiamine-phosphate synthase enzyme YjbQ [Methanosarcinales archaeon]